MRERFAISLALLIVAILLPMTGASPTHADAEVWVTTQDNSRLRSGPGYLFDEITVLPPGTTLRATGRTVDGEWFQVAYEGDDVPADMRDDVMVDGVTYGWIAYWLLIWNGDILELPIDGIETVSYARSMRIVITITPETRYYRDGIDPSTRVTPAFTEPREVEVTGRIGSASGGYFWIQFRMDGEYFWTASWEVGIPTGYRIVPDGSYLYTYGRLLLQLREEISENDAILRSIASRWRRLDSGEQVSCNSIPRRAGIGERNFLESDLLREPIYLAPYQALLAAIDNINEAIRRFEDVCSRTGADRFITPQEVQDALVFVEEAERNMTLAVTLLDPLGDRDPLLYGD